jgi:hypothetical protein
MPDKRRTVHITERDRLVAKDLMEGKTIMEALVGNGYSEKVARKGQAALTNPIKAALLEHGTKYEWMGSRLLENPRLIENNVVGFLYESMLKRTNKGVTAAKLLGSHRTVDMFASDAQQNVLVIASPSDWKQPERSFQPEAQPKALPPGDADDVPYE